MRAIAVLSVILFHAGIAGFGGGFVGVDVFFVISGYLITGLIVGEIAEGRFNFRRFYLRRARRIMPALLFVLAATVPCAWLWLMPEEFREYLQSLLAAILSYANVHYWTKAGYFAPNSENAPLLHTWSLAVEEQFYLIVPALAVVVWRRWGRRVLVFILAVVAIASLVLSQAISSSYPTGNFFLLPSRMWELLAGGLLSFVSVKPSGKKADALAGTGLVMVLASVVVYDAATPFPSIYTLLPVCGTALLLGFGVQGTHTAKLLATPPFVWIGRISYSAYLWHQPIFVFARIRSVDELGQAHMIALSALSLVLAYFSWRFIELPFRYPVGKRARSDRYFAMFMVSSGAALAVFALIGNFIGKGFPFRISPEILAFQQSTEWNRHCLFEESQPFPQFPIDECTQNVTQPQRFVIWGDSVASSISEALASNLEHERIGLLQLTHGYCAPVQGVMRTDAPAARNCAQFNDAVVKQILATPTVGTVILSGSWDDFFKAISYSIDGRMLNFSREADRSEISRHLDETIEEFESAGKTVVLVYPHPRPTFNVTEVLMGRMLRGTQAKGDITLPAADFVAATARTESYLNAAGSAKTIRVHPSRNVCESSTGGNCFISAKGQPLISDRLHFTPFGARYVVDAIMDKLHLHGDGDEPQLPFAEMRKAPTS